MDDEPGNPENPDEVVPAPPSRRARFSILAVALVAYLLLACMVIAVGVLLAARYGHFR